MAKKKFYAVAIGRTPGVYESWPECERQVNECIDRHLLVSQFVPIHSIVLYNTRQKVFVAHGSRAFLLKYQRKPSLTKLQSLHKCHVVSTATRRPNHKDRQSDNAWNHKFHLLE